jgi:hypothetical protein
MRAPTPGRAGDEHIDEPETAMKSKLFLLAFAVAAAAPLHATASDGAIASTDDARRVAQVMHARGETAMIEHMLAAFTPRTTDDARALAGVRIEYAGKSPDTTELVALPSTTDEVRASYKLHASLSPLTGTFEYVYLNA